MRLHWEKYLFFFFILFAVCSQIVKAQSGVPGQISFAGTELPGFKVETPEPVTHRSIVVDRPHEIVRSELAKPISETNQAAAVLGGEVPPPDFRAGSAELHDQHADFRGSSLKTLEKITYQAPLPPAFDAKKLSDDAAPDIPATGFNWRGALTQSFMFLGVQHGFALILQEKTRRSLKGKFWGDYVDSVKALHGWDDGGRFFTNYIAHPMQGSFTGFIYVQNSPQARRAQFGASRDYWSSRMKAMLWTAVWSTQFEIGPISQASIGNVGLSKKQTWEDIVVTPTLGTVMLIAEDAVDRYIIRSIERRWDNFYVKIFSRMILNPTRLFANMLRFKAPWYRDRPTAR